VKKALEEVDIIRFDDVDPRKLIITMKWEDGIRYGYGPCDVFTSYISFSSSPWDMSEMQARGFGGRRRVVDFR